jgi:uncharacterized protein
MQEILFHSETFGDLCLDQAISEISKFIRMAPEFYYKIAIGSDSEGVMNTKIVTAITAHRVGKGAIHFWTCSMEKIYATLRDRIWDEALRSITLGQEIRTRLKHSLKDEYFWDSNEIHVDAGYNGPTADFLDGIIGMIRGYQFEPIIKPFAFGASTVADRHT